MFHQLPIVQYFSIASIILLSNILLTIATSERNGTKSLYHDSFVLDATELILYSNDSETIYHCSIHDEYGISSHQLTVSKERKTFAAPDFQLDSEPINSTTIRIRIKPNGYVGVNRIICHLKNNYTYGVVTDLIVGDDPGVVILRKPCEAYDRLYVECRFHAPIFARAFRNGFPRLYEFSETYSTKFYEEAPELLNITDDGDLIFKFTPLYRNEIPAKVSMIANISISRFHFAIYEFDIEPRHITEVDFEIKNVSKNTLTVMINHKNSEDVQDRLCAGVINHMDDKNQKIIFTRPIAETTSRAISISRLHSSTNYSICLHCFYEQTDYSFQKKSCRKATTKGMSQMFKWAVGCAVCSGTILFAIIMCIFCNYNISVPDRPIISRRSTEPSMKSEDEVAQDNKYMYMDDMVDMMEDTNRISQEAVALVKPRCI